MQQILVLLNQAGAILQPFTCAANANSSVYDGTSYAAVAATETPDPYALAWWSSIQTTIGLLNEVTSLTNKQLDYLLSTFCGGMGSFNDFWLDVSRWGQAAETANAQLDMIRSSLFDALKNLSLCMPNPTFQRTASPPLN